MSAPPSYPQAEAYLEAAAEHQLVVPLCLDCDEYFFPPRVVCPYCLGDDLILEESDGRGALYSFSIVRTEGHPGRGNAAPYPVALVELDDGPVIFSTVVECDPNKLSVGMGLTVEFRELTEGQPYPVFVPA